MSESVDAFRALREAWFRRVLFTYAHERVWEEEDECAIREERNGELQKKYDKQTEEILQGKKRIIAPECANDLLILN